jgi:hypothetical protein
MISPKDGKPTSCRIRLCGEAPFRVSSAASRDARLSWSLTGQDKQLSEHVMTITFLGRATNGIEKSSIVVTLETGGESFAKTIPIVINGDE